MSVDRRVGTAGEPAATSRRFRFVVRFAGSHDGEVDLRCAFSVPAGGAPRQLVVQVVHRHAQFTGLSLAAE